MESAALGDGLSTVEVAARGSAARRCTDKVNYRNSEVAAPTY
jgi:hypothetical protein